MKNGFILNGWEKIEIISLPPAKWKVIRKYYICFFFKQNKKIRLIVVAVTLGLDSSDYINQDNSTTTSNIIITTTASSSSINQTLSSNQTVGWIPEIDEYAYEDMLVVVADRFVQPVVQDSDPCRNVLQLLLIVKTVLLALALLLEIFMAQLALRGTMWDVQPRRLMEYVLYTRLRTLI